MHTPFFASTIFVNQSSDHLCAYGCITNGASKVINSLCIFDELSVKAPFCQHSTYQMLKMVFHFRIVDTRLVHFTSFSIRQPLFRYFDGFVLCINFLLQSFKINQTFLKWVFWNCVYTRHKGISKNSTSSWCTIFR